MTDIKNIFISHIHEDDDGLEKLKSLALNNGLVVRDGSINATKPNNAANDDYILYKIIRPRIERCGVLVVYITPNTRHSKWVDKEIFMADRLGKRIVGIWAHGHAGCKPPDSLAKMAHAMVGWQGGRVVDALTGKFDGYEKEDGSVREPLPFIRIECG